MYACLVEIAERWVAEEETTNALALIAVAGLVELKGFGEEAVEDSAEIVVAEVDRLHFADDAG